MSYDDSRMPFHAADHFQKYIGFFSNNKSTDFVLKVLFVLFQFLLLLILTAWYITRKTARVPAASVVRVQPKTPALKEFLKEFTEPFVLVEYNKKRELMFVISHPEMVCNPCFVNKLIYARPHLAFDDWKATTVFSLNYEEMRVVSLVARFAIDDMLHAESLFTECLDDCVCELADQLRLRQKQQKQQQQLLTCEMLLDFTQSYLKEAVFGYSCLCDDLQPQLDSILLNYLGFFKSAHLLNPNCDRQRLQRMQQRLHDDIKAFLDHFISDTHSSLADKAVSFAEKFIKEKASFDLCGISDTEFVTANHMVQEALDLAALGLSILPDLLFCAISRIAAAPNEFFDCVDVSDNLSVEAALEEVLRFEGIGADVCQFYTTADFVCSGQELPVGSLVSLNIARVNADARLFGRPQQFRWGRFVGNAAAAADAADTADAADADADGIDDNEDGDDEQAAAAAAAAVAGASPLRAVYGRSAAFKFCAAAAAAALQHLLLRFHFSPASANAVACCDRTTAGHQA